MGIPLSLTGTFRIQGRALEGDEKRRDGYEAGVRKPRTHVVAVNIPGVRPEEAFGEEGLRNARKEVRFRRLRGAVAHGTDEVFFRVVRSRS